jgi:hypothetical protein
MDPMTIGLMAGMGLAKSELVDRPKEREQRRQAAVVAKYSPWTGMAPGAIQTADPLGSAMESGLTGAMLSQNQQKLNTEKTLADAKMKDAAEVNLTGGAGASPQQFPFQMMEMQNQSVDPRLMSRRPMY